MKDDTEHLLISKERKMNFQKQLEETKKDSLKKSRLGVQTTILVWGNIQKLSRRCIKQLILPGLELEELETLEETLDISLT